MQIAVVNNMAVSRKGCGSFTEDQASAGGFDMAMAAVLATLNPQPYGSNHASAGSGGENTNALSNGPGNGGFIDLPVISGGFPGDMLIMEPAVSGDEAGGIVVEAVQIPMPETLPKTPQVLADTVPPGKSNDQLLDITGQTIQTVPEETQNTQSTTWDNLHIEKSIYTAGQVGIIAQQPGDAAKELSTANEAGIIEPVAISQAGSAADSPEVVKTKPDVHIRSNTVSFVSASEVAISDDSTVEDGTKPVIQNPSDAKNASLAGSVVNAREMKNAASGSTVAGEPQLAPEKEVVTAFSEKAVMKPNVEKQPGVIEAEQQRNPEFAYQGGNENKLPNNKLREAQAAEENKNIIANNAVVTEKVDSGNGLGTSNTTSNNTQFSAQVSTDSPKGVALPGLGDRVLQEIRYLYNKTGDGERQTQVQLKLEPEQLGHLTIKLYFHKGELNAHFYAANNSVKEVLEGSLQQLRDSLGQQDLKLNEAFVFVGNGSQDNSNLYNERSNESGAVYYGSNDYRNDGDIPQESSQVGETETGSWQVNYLV